MIETLRSGGVASATLPIKCREWIRGIGRPRTDVAVPDGWLGRVSRRSERIRRSSGLARHNIWIRIRADSRLPSTDSIPGKRPELRRRNAGNRGPRRSCARWRSHTRRVITRGKERDRRNANCNPEPNHSAHYVRRERSLRASAARRQSSRLPSRVAPDTQPSAIRKAAPVGFAACHILTSFALQMSALMRFLVCARGHQASR